MPREGLSISADEDGTGHSVQVLRVQAGAEPPGGVQDDDHSIDEAWPEADNSKTPLNHNHISQFSPASVALA